MFVVEVVAHSAGFEHLFLATLNKHAPMKTKYLRANNSPFMNKELTKAIMVRSRLKNKSLKLKTTEAREAYKKQRNFCVSLLRRIKKNFYENLDPKLISDNKKFWKQVKPIIFSDKSPRNGNILLLEDDDIIRNPTKCAEIFNRYFISAIESLEIDRTLYTNNKVYDSDPVELAIKKYKNHPSIIKIHQEGHLNNNFSFTPISQQDIHDIINNIDSSKAYQKENIPPKILKDNVDICAMTLTSDVNNCLKNGIFPDNLKYGDITPIFKKDERLDKTNYRPISILPTLSKIYEKVIYHQMYEYFDIIFSKFLCGFRKGQSTQHSLLYMLESLRKVLDKGLYTGILLTDLSKAFDSISHELLIAKLQAYGFSKEALNLINNYLSNRFQRTKIGEHFSTWLELIFGVPQGSILGALLFNIFINDLFLFSQSFDMANYADDCSPYESGKSTEEVILKLEKDSRCLLDWVIINCPKPNPDKWHLLLSDKSTDHVIKIGNKCISNSKEEKILGVYFDNKLNFNTHLKRICKKASQKLHALARISNLMSIRQRKNYNERFYKLTI